MASASFRMFSASCGAVALNVRALSICTFTSSSSERDLSLLNELFFSGSCAQTGSDRHESTRITERICTFEHFMYCKSKQINVAVFDKKRTIRIVRVAPVGLY